MMHPRKNDTIIDLRAVWQCGMSNDAATLDLIAECFGLPRVKQDKPFHMLRKTSRAAGSSYLVDNLTLMHACAVAMGLMARDELPHQQVPV